MNRSQLAVLWLGIIIAALMLLFSPYLTEGTSHPILHRSLLSPPDLVSKDAPGLMALASGLTGSVPAPVDVTVLLAQLEIVGLLALGLIVTLRDEQSINGR